MYPQGGCPTGYYASNYCCYNGTPIVIDAFKEGFHLTSEIAGVNFHIHRNGPLYRVSWTDPQWHNGWLALDRNGNGTIDDFTELFGNLTPQPPSRTPNGYAALAVFDDPANGGNGNGVIDPGDSVYDKLRVWIDANHKGYRVAPTGVARETDIAPALINLLRVPCKDPWRPPPCSSLPKRFARYVRRSLPQLRVAWRLPHRALAPPGEPDTRQ